jgi:Gpi18-like mannosyltransferase
MQEFRNNGAAALGGEFSNYNFPYLLLMYLSSLLPIEPIFAIKLVSLLGDGLLAISTGLIFQQFRSSRLPSVTAALLVLFVPTVLINASMWGQCDAFTLPSCCCLSEVFCAMTAAVHGCGGPLQLHLSCKQSSSFQP